MDSRVFIGFNFSLLTLVAVNKNLPQNQYTALTCSKKLKHLPQQPPGKGRFFTILAYSTPNFRQVSIFYTENIE